MVAARDIKPGEIIFKEDPLTFGPSDNTPPICLGCYKKYIRTDLKKMMTTYPLFKVEGC